MALLGKTRNPDFLFNANQETTEMAKSLRKRATKAENALWQRIRNGQIEECKFRRQHPIEYYVADFYCHELRLVIEVDGPVHSIIAQIEHDENRTGELDRIGIKVIRFTNHEVLSNIEMVTEKICTEIKSRKRNLPLSSKERGPGG